MTSLENISLHGLDQSSSINCIMEYNGYGILTINSSIHVNFSNLSFQHCNIVFESSSNFTITGSFSKDVGFTLKNVLDTRIESSIFVNVYASIFYNPPSVCYNELHHYSLVLANLIMTGDYPLYLQLSHGTSYNLSVTINNVNIIAHTYGIDLYLVESLFSLYITNSSASNSQAGFLSSFNPQKMQSKNCDINGIQSQSTVLLKDCQFSNNKFGLRVREYPGLSNHHVIIKSCSIHNNTVKGLYIDGHLSTSTQISIIDTELTGNTGNEITKCVFILLNNVTFTRSLSTGLLLKESIVTVENRLAFKNNTGAVGGGIAKNGSSVVVLSSSAYLEFVGNHASYKGGAIYIDEEADFYFASVAIVPLTLKYNAAGVAGYDIYGLILSFHQFNLTNPKISTSSIASKVTFCNPDGNGATQSTEQHIFPGQPLKYHVALFGHNYHTDLYDSPTDGTVLIVGNNGAVMKHIYITSKCSLIEYTPNQLSYKRHRIIIDINQPART